MSWLAHILSGPTTGSARCGRGLACGAARWRQSRFTAADRPDRQPGAALLHALSDDATQAAGEREISQYVLWVYDLAPITTMCVE
jgi:hypothetical protein